MINAFMIHEFVRLVAGLSDKIWVRVHVWFQSSAAK